VILLPLPTPFDSHLLSGVSAHLEHNQPAIRRLGMLVAELVSVKAAASGATGSKPLTFGRALWDGPGDGRSEARALRRLHAAPQLVGGGVPTDAVQLLGLGASLSPPPPPPAATLPVVPRHRSAPISEALPRRVPAPQRSRPLIQALSDDELDSEISLQPSTGSKPLVSRMSDWSSSSSSEDNSSSSSGDEMPLGGLEELGIGPDAIPGLSKPKDEEEFGMGVPKKKRRRTPVYVGELAPLLREQDRSANRLGLKSAASLLRRKRGWGGEIDDNAVDLAFALCGMQDNYSLKAFETRRGQALSALLVASPRLAAP
jgi:telomere length regulation protein